MTSEDDTIFSASDNREELLDLLLAAEGFETTRIDTSIPRADRSRSIPLSLIQQRLWFLDQLEPGNAAYNLPYAIRLRGPLRVDVLEKGLNEIVKRHDILRTTFMVEENQPIQVIHPFSAISIPIINLEELASSERELEAIRVISEDARLPFDLVNGPLMRAHLLQLGSQEFIFYLTIHHIVSDDWSMGIFLQELIALYETIFKGEQLSLKELPIQYADYAVWQRNWLQGENLNAQLQYWKEHLGGELQVLDLPLDHPRPPIQTFHGDTVLFSLSTTLVEKLNRLCKEEGLTLFMALLAGFNVLLHRYSGQDDILVGTPISCRSRPELETLIGFFINTLVVRTDLSGNPSFRSLLRRVRHVVLEDYAHQDLPFEHLVKELHLERDLSRNPLFQVMFGFLNTPETSGKMRDLSVELLDAEKRATQFDLWVILWENNQGAVGRIEYNVDLFERATIEKLIQHYIQLLECVVMDPDVQLSNIQLFDEKERECILVNWNATKKDYAFDGCLHELFEAQARLTPLADAVLYEEERLTYHELDQRTNQLASYLQKQGIGPDMTVGVCMERSIELVIALLGILKAGGAYVPLDPDYPAERLTFMLEDSRVFLLLTQSHLLGRLASTPAQVVALDTAWDEICHEPVENVPVKMNADNLAYMIYTSGSTGWPKGAMNTHKGVVNRLLWMQDMYCLVGEDRVLQKTPFSFDVSVWEFFWPLIAGACLVVAPPGVHKDSTALLNLVISKKISVLHFVPSMLRIFLEELGLEQISLLRRVICSGEALLTDDQTRFNKRLKANLSNLYGPTEASVDVTYWDCAQDLSRSIVPIGRPIANTQIYLLDRWMNPVPAGATGELYIGGVGLGRGYHGKPALTAEKFVPNPFGKLSGTRLYRTGDLARFNQDGCIEFLGRLDHQVKIRGNRIELGEIETVLREYIGVKDVVVLAREDKPGDKRLVAYIVSDLSEHPSSSELRRFLATKLPESMLPAAFLHLNVIPLLPNGKIDRRALPIPDGERPGLENDFVPPRIPIERTLSAIWSEILGIEQIGIFDNFFELGGDSILSIQVVARAKQTGLHLSTRQIFQYQTIAALATVVEANSIKQEDTGPSEGSLPLMPIQHWFFEQELTDAHHFNQALMLEVNPALSIKTISSAIEYLFEIHDALRMRFKKLSDGWEEYYSSSKSDVPFSYIDLKAIPLDLQRERIEQSSSEFQKSLDLVLGPIGQVVFFELGQSQPNRLLLIFHHLVIDGVSWRIILNDLQTILLQLEQGIPVQLPARTTSVKDWAERLLVYSKSETLHSEKAYWAAGHLDAGKTSLPRDYPANEDANTVASARVVSSHLFVDETQALIQDIFHVYHTRIEDFLLAALAQTIIEWTGNHGLRVDMEGHGREEEIGNVDLSRTVGWFTTIYPLSLTLPDVQDPGDVIRAIKEQIRMVPNHGIGYGCIRYLYESLDSRQTIRELPQSEICFNYLGQLDSAMPESPFFALASESCGAEQSLRNKRHYLLDITAMVREGCLQINWVYSNELWNEPTIQNLSERLINHLRHLIAHCQSSDGSFFTSSDFPLAKLNQEKLDKLSKLIDDIDDED
jgi:amino acid adenylation domain-containing protein/non-ribosomal peptide synthase protein (TIGR01720 family)